VKLCKSKYENHLLIWHEFDLNCAKIAELFISSYTESLKEFDFISSSIEIEKCLTILKENHHRLASVCFEKKYREMKDLIIFYELQLKKFRNNYKEKMIITSSKNNILLQKNIERHDKSTVSIYDTSTQTDKSKKHRFNNLDRLYFKNSTLCKFNQGTEDNKFLLEAGLSKYENKANDHSKTSSTFFKINSNEKRPLIKKSRKPKIQENEKTPSNFRFHWIFKLIYYIRFFLLAIGLIFLVTYYNFLYFDPSCCNYHPNYLICNII